MQQVLLLLLLLGLSIGTDQTAFNRQQGAYHSMLSQLDAPGCCCCVHLNAARPAWWAVSKQLTFMFVSSP
jgi:hypothetical protein